MSHDPHQDHPRFSPAQILKDGCRECTRLAALPDRGIGTLDSHRFGAAWKRAADWQQDKLRDISQAEIPLLLALWSVEVQLAKRAIPIGEVPGMSIGRLSAAAGIEASVLAAMRSDDLADLRYALTLDQADATGAATVAFSETSIGRIDAVLRARGAELRADEDAKAARPGGSQAKP